MAGYTIGQTYATQAVVDELRVALQEAQQRVRARYRVCACARVPVLMCARVRVRFCSYVLPPTKPKKFLALK